MSVDDMVSKAFDEAKRRVKAKSDDLLREAKSSLEEVQRRAVERLSKAL